MNLFKREIGFILFIADVFLLIAVILFSIFSVRSSYQKLNNQLIEQAIAGTSINISNYQSTIEGIIASYIEKNDSFYESCQESISSIYPNIKIISVSNNARKICLDNLAGNSQFIINKKLPISNFSICSAYLLPDGLWIKSIYNSNKFSVEYAFKFEELAAYLKSINGTQIFTNISSKTSFDKYLSNNKNWPITFGEGGKYYSADYLAEFINPSNSVAGYCYQVVDASAIKIRYKSVFYIAIIAALMLIMVPITFYYWRKSSSKKVSSKFPIADFHGEAISKLYGKHEISQIFNATANGIRIINNDFDIVSFNESFCKISGLKPDQLDGQKCYNVFQGLHCHTADCPLERIKNGESRIESNEFRFRNNGEKIRCNYTAVPLLNSDNELIGIIEDCRDITEKYNVEETLKQTEKEFKVFMDSLPLGVFVEDGITHEILYQNTYLQTITGGKSIKGFLPVENPDRSQKSYLESEEEHQLVDINGRWKYFLTHKFKFLGVNSQLKIGGVMIDITKKKEAEHYRDLLSKAIENSPVSVAILSSDTEIEFINPSFSSLTGYCIDEIYSKDILALNIEYNSGNNLTKAVECVRSGEIWQGEIHLKNRDGDHFWVSASFTPIIADNGKVQHAVAIMENITKRKEYEKEILFAKSKAEESDKLKTSFLSNLSHEIRTPLNAIIGFSSLLADNDLSFAERRNISEIIYRNSNDLLHLIENLIEISEIETGQLNIRKKEFSVNNMMSDLYRQLIDEDKKASGVKLSLRKEVHQDDLTILSDQTRVQQVLYHLVSNSFKFTEKGFIEFGYTFKDESTLMFYVVDSGIGIDSDKQSVIFNPFRQVDDSNTRRYGGMGLGLAISKHIIEKLGGKIWLSSVPGSGTNVYFTIPYIPVNSKFDADIQNPIKLNYSWENKTILVADDIDANFVYLKAALKNTNAQVLWARNGLEAVDFIKQGTNINLILMDLVMPEMDGFEATRQIKTINNSIPIIGQTAYPSQKNYENAHESGFDSMLEKPIKVNRMLMELDKFLSN